MKMQVVLSRFNKFSYLTSLSCFWKRHRAEFLGHLKPCESQSSAASGPESGNWTLVDEGGEEVCVVSQQLYLDETSSS